MEESDAMTAEQRSRSWNVAFLNNNIRNEDKNILFLVIFSLVLLNYDKI